MSLRMSYLLCEYVYLINQLLSQFYVFEEGKAIVLWDWFNNIMLITLNIKPTLLNVIMWTRIGSEGCWVQISALFNQVVGLQEIWEFSNT